MSRILKRVLWVEKLHGDPCRCLWEEIEVIRAINLQSERYIKTEMRCDNEKIVIAHIDNGSRESVFTLVVGW